METNDMKKYATFFYCEKCDYKCSKQFLWKQHISTRKHIWKHLETKPEKSIKCETCEKVFANRSGLWKHKQKCIKKQKEESSSKDLTVLENSDCKDDLKSLIIKIMSDSSEKVNLLMNENKELRNQLREQSQQITELIPKVGNNNNNRNKFNINVFLNEKCKDALSIDEFIEGIEISLTNLLTTKSKGQTEGITDIIMENMNKLSLYKRPVHCTDKKREILYIKNEQWKRDENMESIDKMLKQVEKKQLKNIKKWMDNHPNYENSTEEQNEFTELLRECTKSIDDGREKIVKNLCNTLYVDKE